MTRTTLRFIAYCFLPLLLHPQADAQPKERPVAQKRPVTVADAVEMEQIGDRLYLEDFAKMGNVAQFSPDGTKFAFVVQKGNLARDAVDYSVLVFNTAKAFSAGQGAMVATLSSTSNRPGISKLTWLRDNDTLVFIGEQPDETPQIYSVSHTGRTLKKLTNHPTGVIGYSISDDAQTFVFLAERPRVRPISDEMLQHGFAVTSQRWEDLYVNGAKEQGFGKEILVKTPALREPRSLGVIDVYDEAYVHGLSVSPSGLYALIAAYNLSSPKKWREYKLDVALPEVPPACSHDDAYLCASQYLLIDLRNFTMAPLWDAPVLMPNDVRKGMGLFAWTRESSLLMVNALLPLESANGADESRRHNLYTIELKLPQLEILKITEGKTPVPAVFVEAETDRNRFVTTPLIDLDGPPMEYRKSGTQWSVKQLTPEEHQSSGRLAVTLFQDNNSPPKLMATDPRSGSKAYLLDLNPQFAHLTFGRVETLQWKTAAGQPAEGALYYPPDYVPGKRYPLVIQTHGYSRDRFWIDGPFSTAYAAQPLANHGFLVLQMQMGDLYNKESIDEVGAVMDTAKEGPYFTAFFESAVAELDHRGLVDPARVGLTGFSRTVYHVLYALTHSRFRFAAAVVADGVSFGYTGCLFYMAAQANTASVCERMNGGGPPFGPTLNGWAHDAPNFNLDKVQTPLLLQAIAAPLNDWELFMGLKWLGKPVELLNFYPEGSHILVRPRQRLLSQQSVVDWYCFWLQNEEDSEPSKAGQYARWRAMRQGQIRASSLNAN